MDLSLSLIKENISRFFARYHFLIFFVLIIISLSVAMFTLNQTIIASDDTSGYKSDIEEITLDTATIDKLRQLRTSSESSSADQLDFNNGRINPF